MRLSERLRTVHLGCAACGNCPSCEHGPLGAPIEHDETCDLAAAIETAEKLEAYIGLMETPTDPDHRILLEAKVVARELRGLGL